MKLKSALTDAFIPPKSQKKAAFLATLPCRKLTYFSFVLAQIGYIRKRIWLFSALTLLGVLGAACFLPQDKLYVVLFVSALMPFLALLTITELARSDLFLMSEIEDGCKFSLPQLAGARIIILGVCNLFVIVAFAAILRVFSPLGLFHAAVTVLTPYIAVQVFSLFLLDKIRGMDGVYTSVAVALIVSLGSAITTGKHLYDTPFFTSFCTLLCAVGAVFIVSQSKKIIGRKEVNDGTHH